MQDITSNITLWRWFLSGGPLMWPILLCSFFSLAIVIQKFFYFSKIAVDITMLKNSIFEALKRNDIKEALGLCDQQDSPMGRVLKAGILQMNSSQDSMTDEMQSAAQFAVAEIEDHLSILSTIGQVAPLLGFLGTVSGMASSFYMVHARAAAMNPLAPPDIAGGIWQALIATIAGFLVTIPTVIAYHYFIDRRNRYVFQMEQLATELARFLGHLRAGLSKE